MTEIFQVIWFSDLNSFYDLFSFKLSFSIYFFIKSILHSGENVILGVNTLCDIVYNKYFGCSVFMLCVFLMPKSLTNQQLDPEDLHISIGFWSIALLYWSSSCPFLAEWRKVAHLGPTLCNPMDYTVHGILYDRILEWVTFPFSRISSQPRDRT